MLHLKQVIQKISGKDSKEFTFWLKQNEAEKCSQLFSLLREGKLEESAIATELQVNSSAFYALKSRLNSKIQDFFAHNVPDSNIDLLKNIANIPNLLFNSPREIAITHLLKMEKELIEHDMPYALTSVYSAMKKLKRYSQKYFDYTQLYNKHLAYTMAIDKAKDLLSDFNKTLGEFLMSRDKKLLEVLIIIRQEMHNYAQLYESHHLMVYQNMLDVEFELFVCTDAENETGVAVDEILLKTEKILTSYKNDASYGFLKTLINFLWFQYYHKHELHKKAAVYYELVNKKLSGFLLNNFCCFPSVFLLSKIERSLDNNEEKKLYEESQCLADTFSPDIEDAPNYINYVKFQAIAAFYSKKYSESVSLLNGLLNNISLRNFPHAEIEIKLFLAVCYLFAHKSELAETLVKNVQRKLRDLEPGRYANARSFAKMISVLIDPNNRKNNVKWVKIKDRFNLQNQTPEKMLVYIRLNDPFLKMLIKNNSEAATVSQSTDR